MPVQGTSAVRPGAQVAVIGGGASGCMAAIAAAKAGCSVILFEKNEKIAKKIYATGNGRCNLTNLYLDGSCYHAGSVDRVMDWIGRFPAGDLLAFFAEAGVPVHDREGYVYPRTDQAETVGRALEKCIHRLPVRVLTGCEVLSVRPENGGFRIDCALASEGAARSTRTDPKKGRASKGGKKRGQDRSDISVRQETFVCDSVILCTGGLAGPSFGCSGDGYQFARRLGHEIIPPLPALTKMTCADTILKRAAGVRCQAGVTLYAGPFAGPARDWKCLAREEGELQITENSLSGIPVFQLSGQAAAVLAGGGSLCAEIDFLPEFSQETFQKEVERRLQEDRGQMLGDLLLGLAHRKVIDLVLAAEGLQAEMKASRLDEEGLRRILYGFRCFMIEVTGTGTYDHAQVTAGGVSLDQVREDLSSAVCPGLFFAGELLDVDGRCGGYNLQWAMSSGTLAGRAAADYTRRLP